MKIIVTVNAAWNIWNFRRPVIKALIEDGHSVTVLAPPDQSLAMLEQMGCRIEPLQMDSKGLNPVRDFALLLRLRSAFRTHRPDAILSYTIKNNIYGALAARTLGIPFIPNVTGLGTAFLSGGALRHISERLYRAAFNSLTTVFFENSDDRDLFVSRQMLRFDQAYVVPGTGIDLKHFAKADYPSADAAPVFLMIGRLLRDKGVYEFADAARRVKDVYPEARFQLLGPAAAENRTAIDRATVARWEQSPGIEYLGTCEDVRGHIASANCIVLPSYREGAPRTLIEAASMARPLIATDVPGCRSVVNDTETGYLCKPRNGESLAKACVSFLALSRDQQAAFGMAGRRKMEREFGEERVITAYRRAISEGVNVALAKRKRVRG
ncbi:glycosyltransferase family 4 protein [Qipengyuania citrea]|uniref:glycosyltransferase family 4 protein n=1 Tax=Qipengyuania citrea TaxID=225971 RepID=UPI003298D6DD